MHDYTHQEMLDLFKSYMRPPKKGAHAVLSASGSERWLGCPGSVRLSDGIPQEENQSAITGTKAHTLLQFILENKRWQYLLRQPEAASFKEHIEFSSEQLDTVMLAVDYVKSEQARIESKTGKPPTLYVEHKVELEGVGHGTADIILYQPFGLLHVMDYKNGRSVVHPENNTQGLYYAHAAADLFGWDFKDIWITIIQPNATHRDGPIRTWKTTPKILEKAGQLLKDGAIDTKKKDAPLVADHKWCFFCPARKICPELMRARSGNIMERFER